MVRAMAWTLGWMRETPAAEIAALLQPEFPDVAQPIFAAAIARYQAACWAPALARLSAGSPAVIRSPVPLLAVPWAPWAARSPAPTPSISAVRPGADRLIGTPRLRVF